MTQPLSVLHVEDEPNDAELVASTLLDDGIACSVEVVSTRARFLEALARGGFDLILSDFSLPAFDGLSALGLAREMTPDTPFIFVSGVLGEEAAIERLKSGATDYVLKHRLARLAPAVRRALAEAAERRKRRETERVLHEEREFLRALLDSLTEGIVACNSEGTLTLFNRTTREWHAVPEAARPPELKTFERRLLLPDGKTQLPMDAFPLVRALGGERVRDVELLIQCGDGTERAVLVNGQPILDAQGRKLGAVVAAHDVSEKRQLERQLQQAQKMEAIGRLAGGIAHDFNNLLSVILGYGELILSDLEAGSALHGRISEIHRAGKRAADLTRQLLAFSRKQIIEPRILDLNALVLDTETMLRRLIGADVELVTRLASRIARVKADPGQLEQIILNLTVNARDAMPEGGKITFETADVECGAEFARRHPGAAAGPYVMLAVRDTGVGMTPEIKAKIFEPFFTTKEPGKGTGLGLATVYGIVRQSDGYISVDSRPGSGTTFSVYLPHVEGPADGGTPRAAAGAPPKGVETVLVVEDEEAVRDLISEGLKQLGYSVLSARDGAQALEVSRRHPAPIHLLLIDVVLPGRSGREVAADLTRLRPDLAVLYTSGHTDDEAVRHRVLDHGPAFLQKPFSQSDLALKLREVLDAALSLPAPAAGRS